MPAKTLYIPELHDKHLLRISEHFGDITARPANITNPWFVSPLVTNRTRSNGPARILRYELTSDDLQKVGMFVTLQIFCKPMLSAMLQEVTDRLTTHWMTGLISEYSGKHPDIWTEYTLYDLYGERSGLREKHHIEQDELPRRRLHC